MKSINSQGKDPKERIVIVLAILLFIVGAYLKLFTNHFD